jgi:hypothetical protein
MLSEISCSYGYEYENGFSGMLRCVSKKITDVSDILASIITVLMMEAVTTSETSASIYQAKQRNTPEDDHLQLLIIYICI